MRTHAKNVGAGPYASPLRKKVGADHPASAGPLRTKEPQVRVLPLLPLRDIVVFPHMVVPLLVGREKSVKAVEAALAGAGGSLFVAAQKSAQDEVPSPADIHPVGTVCKIIQMLKMPDGSAKILVEGLARGKIVSYAEQESFFTVEVAPLCAGERGKTTKDTKSTKGTKGRKGELTVHRKALMRSLAHLFESYLEGNPRIPPDMAPSVREMDDPEQLTDTVCAHVMLRLSEKQELLSAEDIEMRMTRLIALLHSEIEILEIERDINSKVRKQIEKGQKAFYLTEQKKAIEAELGSEGLSDDEIEQLKKKVVAVRMTGEAQEKALSELERMAKMPSISPEATVSRNYVDWLISLPWSKTTKDNLDIRNAERVLKEDHYGLEEPKERILEYLAVRKLSRKMRGPVLCLVGPPGVGKTSLARSVARALGRKFVRVSLGGVRDEAEIRGHRRTYIGALPGRIIQSMKKVHTRNPVFLLDEVDKISADFRGDPSSALLEVLDPEQNHAFDDHYIEVDFDLSDVLFIATANLEDAIHPTLLDRMEVIRIPGYTEWEKLEIARGFLVPKQLRANGLSRRRVRIDDEALLRIIREYTREAGVRNLEREISKICRKIARKLASHNNVRVIITPRNLRAYLGNAKFRYQKSERRPGVGVATGLAWTEVGGEILKVETLIMEGKGEVTLTGQLGEVMKESARAAISYIRAHRSEFGLANGFHSKNDIHVHVPEGQVPKDGPSAGIAIAVSVLSALTGRTVRGDLAMTGEITLRGDVLPVGGIKEKVLAAHRSGIAKIILPWENRNDLKELPEVVLADCEFIITKNIKEVIDAALAVK
ncbi:MAG: endopeptidase La [bacterium]|nr:endopeptidase La [bacterium]